MGTCRFTNLSDTNRITFHRDSRTLHAECKCDDFFFPEVYTEMGNAACKPEVLVGFLNFEMGLLEKILVCTSQPRIGALRCRAVF